MSVVEEFPAKSFRPTDVQVELHVGFGRVRVGHGEGGCDAARGADHGVGSEELGNGLGGGGWVRERDEDVEIAVGGFGGAG